MQTLRVDRRGFLGAAGAAAAAACAPGTAPTPAPQGQTASQKAAWETQWDQLVTAAKGEGQLAVLTLAGSGYRKALDVFEQTFGIGVELQSFASATLFTPRILQERQSGIYSFDVAQISPGTALREMKPQGVWDPLRPVLFRPDVLDDQAWQAGGFDGAFADIEKSVAFSAFEFEVRHAFAIDTNVVKPDEIKQLKDLLDPKWKGKMIYLDVRTGDAGQAFTAVRLNVGEAAVKALLVDQAPTFTLDIRQVAEGLVRGRNPIAMGVRPIVLKEFRDAGLGQNIKYLDLPEADYIPSTAVFLFNKAPHPNAAKLFLNWVLTKEGQTVWSKENGSNSRRTDVPPANLEVVPSKGKTYNDANKEEIFPEIIKTQVLIKDLAGIKD
jgi:iron(III) transport system substrate-binding protein